MDFVLEFMKHIINEQTDEYRVIIMEKQIHLHKLGIDIGSTTVKVAVLGPGGRSCSSADYERHFANIRETLSALLQKGITMQLGDFTAGTDDYRFRRTDPRQASCGCSVCPGGDRRVHCPAALCHRRPTLPSSSVARMPRSSILRAAMSSSV